MDRRERDEATVAKAMVAADFDAKGPLWSEFGRRYLREEFVATMWPVVLPHARAAIRAVVGEWGRWIAMPADEQMPARTPLEAAGDALNSCLHGAPSGKEMAANVVAAYLRAEAGNCPNLEIAGLFRIMAAEVEREGSGG